MREPADWWPVEPCSVLHSLGEEEPGSLRPRNKYCSKFKYENTAFGIVCLAVSCVCFIQSCMQCFSYELTFQLCYMKYAISRLLAFFSQLLFQFLSQKRTEINKKVG